MNTGLCILSLTGRLHKAQCLLIGPKRSANLISGTFRCPLTLEQGPAYYTNKQQQFIHGKGPVIKILSSSFCTPNIKRRVFSVRSNTAQLLGAHKVQCIYCQQQTWHQGKHSLSSTRENSGGVGVLQQRGSITVHQWMRGLPFVSFWRKLWDMLRSALPRRNRGPSNRMEVRILGYQRR